MKGKRTDTEIGGAIASLVRDLTDIYYEGYAGKDALHKLALAGIALAGIYTDIYNGLPEEQKGSSHHDPIAGRGYYED